MSKTTIVINSEDNFVSISTDQKDIITRMKEHKVKSYSNQGGYIQYRMSSDWLTLAKIERHGILSIQPPKRQPIS